MLRDIGIHQQSVQVFHSLRHNNNDWIREHTDERTADLYNGHALQGTSKKYGAKALKEYQARKIHEAPLPTGVDFSPFLAKAEMTQPRPILHRKPIGRQKVPKAIS